MSAYVDPRASSREHLALARRSAVGGTIRGSTAPSASSRARRDGAGRSTVAALRRLRARGHQLQSRPRPVADTGRRSCASSCPTRVPCGLQPRNGVGVAPASPSPARPRGAGSRGRPRPPPAGARGTWAAPTRGRAPRSRGCARQPAVGSPRRTASRRAPEVAAEVRQGAASTHGELARVRPAPSQRGRRPSRRPARLPAHRARRRPSPPAGAPPAGGPAAPGVTRTGTSSRRCASATNRRRPAPARGAAERIRRQRTGPARSSGRPGKLGPDVALPGAGQGHGVRLEFGQEPGHLRPGAGGGRPGGVLASSAAPAERTRCASSSHALLASRP